MSTSPIVLTPASTTAVSCKICGGHAALYGVVDFHKCCEETRGVRLALSGIPIYYRRCGSCGFLFTDAFDAWNEEQFKAHIYNEAYHTIDPDYGEGRARSNARAVVRLWGEHRSGTRVLDFGGGNDALCAALRDAGFSSAVTYDPMVPEHAERPEGKFDLVTCFEALEHMPDPNGGIASMTACVAEPGLILYSTCTQPADFDKQGLAWWYVGPRNGHVSLFSRDALSIAWGRHGYKNISLSDNVHLAFRTLPSFLSHLQGLADNLLAAGGTGRDARLTAAPSTG